MKKANNNYRNKQNKTNSGNKPLNVSSGSTIKSLNGKQLNIIFALAILVITFLTYSYTLQNQFTNWDDNVYVTNDPYIKSITPENLKMMLYHNITDNYYHPITMLSFAANYHFVKMNPEQYYFTNVLFHSINAALMYMLMLMMLGAMEENGYGIFSHKQWFAAFAALCYGLHPMHVESVSWLSERKDVLYGFFYFLALMAYIKYIKVNKTVWLFYTFLLFICSLLSKPLAVTFGLAIIAIDIILKRDKKVSLRRIVLDKSPFILIAMGGGLLAWYMQKVTGAIKTSLNFTFMQKIMFATYSFTSYIYKAFLPVHLSSYYPFPMLSPGGFIPLYFYFFPFIAILLVSGSLYFAFKAGENSFRAVLGGLLFYFFNVMFVLQLVTSGGTIMADRYTYISYFGIFIIVVYLGYMLYQKYPNAQRLFQLLAGAFLLVLCILCYNRTKVWHNTATMWQDVIAKYPQSAEPSCKKLGNYYAQRAEAENDPVIKARLFDSAYHNFKFMEDSLHSVDAEVYINLANIYGVRKQFDLSLAEYSKALKLDSTNIETYINRANTYFLMGDYVHSINDYNKAIRKEPKSEEILLKRGITFMNAKQYANAVSDFSQLTVLNPNKAEYFFDRGKCEVDNGQIKEGINDFNKTISLDPSGSEKPECFFDMSIAYFNLNQFKEALDYAAKAKTGGFNVPDGYMNDLENKSKTK
jgi:tetratricopeptide (TPR) repeat protein